MSIKHMATDDRGNRLDFITISNGKTGMSAVLSNYGAHLIRLLVPGKAGEAVDVCLGYDDLAGYQNNKSYLGATVGRYCNRIGGASFALNGKSYPLYANDGANTLHGGKEGFDKKTWAYEVAGDNQSAFFSYLSPDGEEGFPGNLKITVHYTLTDNGGLQIDYEAVSDEDTVVNFTNHAYFNLAGKGDIKRHLLQVTASSITATTPDLIPTGELMPVDGTPYDLRQPRLLGEVLGERGKNAMFDHAQGYDINFVLDGSGLREAAALSSPDSGLTMRVYTDQPGIQVYSGQGLDCIGKGGGKYGPYAGIALETQHLPDSVHHAHFPDTTLKAGDVFKSTTIYAFDKV
jgi:aldose 1-epimerase